MIEELVRSGSLTRTAPSIEKARKSIELAEDKIEKAREELDAGIFDNCLVMAYTSMFHSARALLFKDGYKERNHYAVCEYLRMAYGSVIERKYINELNILRSIRHKVIYGDENVEAKEIQQAEAEHAIETAKGFVKSVRKILETKGQTPDSPLSHL